MNRRTDRTRTSRPNDLYWTVDAVASRETQLPAVDGPVLVISNAVGKGLWYLSLIHLLRQRGLSVTRRRMNQACTLRTAS